MSVADFFSALRIFLAPVFFIVFFIPQWFGIGGVQTAWILFPLFVFMEFTDFLDGYYARKFKTVSDFGKLFDPFADVLANLTVLFSFVLSGYLPALLFIVILYREMGIMFVRMLASRKGVAIGARKGGKLKTVLYIVAAGFSLLLECATRLGFSLGDLTSMARTINLGLYIIAVTVSVLSFIDYLVHFSSVLRPAEKQNK